MPEISVIVPVYNVESYLHRCVDSILAQTFIDFELLLVDDGSSDESGHICDSYESKDARIRVFHQVNKGQGAARNHALEWMLEHSPSEYVSFIDSDDWVHPRYLELLIAAALKYNTKISQCDFYSTSEQAEYEIVVESSTCVTPEEQYTKWYNACACMKLYKSELFTKLRFPEGMIYEDVAIWYKILFSVDKVAIVNNKLYFYYFREDSTVNNEWNPAKLSQIAVWDEQMKFFQSYGNKELLDAASVHYFQIVLNQMRSVEKAVRLEEKVKSRSRRFLKHKFQKALIKYPTNRNISSQTYDWYKSIAFPKLNWLKWVVIGVVNKLKGFKKG